MALADSKTGGQLNIAIGGMTCASCVSRVEKALQKVNGVTSVEVNLATESARIQFQASNAIESALRRAVREAGYEPMVRQMEGAGSSALIWRAFIPVAVAAILSLPLALPMFLLPLGFELHIPVWVQAALAIPVQFILGWRFYKAGWYALRAKTGNMDLLVALGTSAAWCLSMWLWLTSEAGSHPHVYFEASAVIITLVLLGKWLEARAKFQTTSAIRALHQLRPTIAHVLIRNEETDVPVDEIMIGDTVVVKAGERVPADGVVTQGNSHVDESMLTGEPLPVFKTLDSPITGGTINGNGLFLMSVRATGTDTVLSSIIRLVEDAQAHKAPIQKLVDRVSAIFVPVVVLIALVSFGLCLWWGLDMETSLIRAVTILVIACPCALGLATPAAILTGTGIAAKHGILIKDAQSLELACESKVIVFDKTGTLSKGLIQLDEFSASPGLSRGDNLALAASLQKNSEHILGRAVVQQALREKCVLTEVHNTQTIPGKGLSGFIHEQKIAIGNLRWMTELNVPFDQWNEVIQRSQAEGKTLAMMAQQEADSSWKSLALMAFSDSPKPEAGSVISALIANKYQVWMLTGDQKASALAMAKAIGLASTQVVSDVLPHEKTLHIQKLQAKGNKVMMVGDGINDAPALASADVGIAMANINNGTDVAMHAASITLMRPDLRLLSAALDISEKTVIKIKQNLFWAFIYNVAGIPLAALGYVNPMVAGAAMALSSVSVMANALLLKTWQPNKTWTRE